MKKRQRILSLILTILLLGSAVLPVLAQTEESVETVLPAEYVDYRTELQSGFANDTLKSITLYADGSEEKSIPNAVVCDFSSDGIGSSDSYVFQKASSIDFSDAVTVEGITDTRYEFYNPYLGEHFYWRAGVSVDSITESPIHEVYITSVAPRIVYVDGATNVRDIGGWKSSFGENAYIRQGLFFRGANTESVSDLGTQQMQDLGIKVELDLREENICNGPYVDGVEYVPCPITSQEFGRFDAFEESFCKAFTYIAQADEKPVYLHCHAGADRTGIAAFILLTVCGVSYEDAARDFLFTNFSTHGSRSTDRQYSFNEWYTKLKRYGGDSKAEQAANWLKKKGLTDEQIERIRTIFIENYDPDYDVPSDIKPSSWAEAEVEEAIDNDLVPFELQNGYLSPISRGAVSEMLMRLLEHSTGKDAARLLKISGLETDENTFSDSIDSNVLAANALGIINGTGNGKFSTHSTLTRGQMAALINRVAEVMGTDTKGFTHNFTDITSNYSWLDSELGWPVHAGIINGVGHNKFNPSGFLTTEQAILIINRAYKALYNPRFRTDEGLFPTPEEGSDGYITNFVDEENVVTYLSLNDKSAKKTIGTIDGEVKNYYSALDGYYDDGINLRMGYVDLVGFEPDMDSFSISFLIYCNVFADPADPALISNKDWSSGNNAGFTLSLKKDGPVLLFNAGNGEGLRMDETWNLPVDYKNGWISVIMIVDRENGRVGISYDFEEPDYRDIPETLRDISFAGISSVHLGQDGTGMYSHTANVVLDEVIVFNKALTMSEIERLSGYYIVK